MNISLYASMSEFAPAPTAKKAGEDGPQGQGEETHEEESPHGTLFEQCAPGRGNLSAKASESAGVSARGDAPQHANLTANVPDLSIGSALTEGSLTDGFKLHDVAIFDSGKSDKNPFTGSVTEVAAKGVEPSVPRLELDFSADVAPIDTAQHGAAEPSGRGHATA